MTDKYTVIGISSLIAITSWVMILSIVTLNNNQVVAQEVKNPELLYAIGYTGLQSNGMHYRLPFALMGSNLVNNNDFTMPNNITITKIVVITSMDTLNNDAFAQSCLYDNNNYTNIYCVELSGNGPQEYIVDVNIAIQEGTHITHYIQVLNRTSGVITPTVYIYGVYE